MKGLSTSSFRNIFQTFEIKTLHTMKRDMKHVLRSVWAIPKSRIINCFSFLLGIFNGWDRPKELKELYIFWIDPWIDPWKRCVKSCYRLRLRIVWLKSELQMDQYAWSKVIQTYTKWCHKDEIPMICFSIFLSCFVFLSCKAVGVFKPCIKQESAAKPTLLKYLKNEEWYNTFLYL